MTDFVEGRADAAREQILHAAARQFAVLPYSQVNLDDIVTMADVTKGVLHAHFRSKLALASALVEYHLDVSWDVGATRIALGLGGLETQIDYAYLIAAADIDHYLTRAAFNGVGERVQTFADIARRGVAEGDIRPDSDMGHIARLLTSLYLGVRQTSNLDDAEQFIGDFEAVLLLAPTGFANPDRLPYLTGFVRRRSALAIKNDAPLGANEL